MDHFGIGQAMIGMAQAYFQTSRRTGRSVSLVESLRDGDRVCCATQAEARHLERQCKERGLEVGFIVVNPQTPKRLFDSGTPQGRTLFDHAWVEQFYMEAIKQCQHDIDHMQRQASGFGEAHLETRRKAEEMARWRF